MSSRLGILCRASMPKEDKGGGSIKIKHFNSVCDFLGIQFVEGDM